MDEMAREKANSIVIESARPEDAESIVDVRWHTWLATYPNEAAGITEEDIRHALEGKDGNGRQLEIGRVRARLEHPDSTRATFVAKLNGDVVGFCAPRLTDGQRRIGAIYVLPAAQGLGVGSRLLTEALAWWGDDEAIYLHVASYNDNAIRFYEHHGFQKTGNDATDQVGKLPSGTVVPEIEMILPAKKP